MNELINEYRNLSVHVKASFWFLISSVFQKGVTVLTTPIFTRLLSTSEYGQFQVFNSWMSIVSVFITLKLFYGVYTQGLVKFSDIKDKYSSALQGLTLALVSVGMVIALVFIGFWEQLFSLEPNQIVALVFLCWTNAIYEFWATDKRVSLSYRSIVIASVCMAIFKPAIGIFAVLNSTDKVSARIWGLAIVELIGCLPMFFAQIKRGKTLIDKNIWVYALKFNIPLVPHYLSQTLLIDSDKIMIERMVDKQSAGIYGLAYSIAQIMILFNSALLQTVTPWMYQRIKDNNTKDVKLVIHPALIFIAAMNLVLIGLAPEIVSIFAPKEYYDAIWVVPPIAMSVYYMFTYSVFANMEFYYEKNKFVTVATSIAAGFNILLNYLFIPIVGYVAAGYTTLCGYLIYAVLHYLYMMKICKTYKMEMPCDIKKLLAISIVFCVFGFLIELSYNNNIIRYTICVTLLFIIIAKRKTIRNYITELKGDS